ncbi:hypothetical protein SeMB42_g01748 [Synchytrium endobioticum]|uniref:DNA repair protein rad9 n=1 Tax=Synchytrium endobioticum TaxID=286115 RepID=A0A507DK24_9FUNG|nr:hypothetical protein SeLEV6574_g04439 [Synchytrium endobioticum]TPX51973.1 hypothetical protein SeMB42_g01748 [Synchytrium endobioticum]
MECVLTSAALKPFSKFLTCLSRIGDDLQIEAAEKRVQLWTVNSSRSAYCLFTLADGFFVKLAIHNPPTHRLHANGVNGVNGNGPTGTSPRTVSCKLLLKPFMNIFKGRHNLETVQKCKITLHHPDSTQQQLHHHQVSPDNDRLIVQLLCKHGVIKTHKLNYQLAPDSQKALYTKEACRHKLVVPSKMLGDLLTHFGTNLEEVTLKADGAMLQLKSFTEDAMPAGGNALNHRTDDAPRRLQTELNIDPDDFDTYEIQNEAEVTFGLKELKAIISFAEGADEALSAHFDQKGSPIIFSASATNFFEADLVLATMSGDDNSTPGSQARPPQSNRPGVQPQTNQLQQNQQHLRHSPQQRTQHLQARTSPIPPNDDNDGAMAHNVPSPPPPHINNNDHSGRTPVNESLAQQRYSQHPIQPPPRLLASHQRPPRPPSPQIHHNSNNTFAQFDGMISRAPNTNIPTHQPPQMQQEADFHEEYFDQDLDDFLVGEHSYLEVMSSNNNGSVDQRNGYNDGKPKQPGSAMDGDDDEEIPPSPPRGPHVDGLLKRLEVIRGLYPLSSQPPKPLRPVVPLIRNTDQPDDDDEEVPPTLLPLQRISTRGPHS